MVVILKDGTKFKILPEMVNMISQRIIDKEGAKPWQSFTDDKDDSVICLINLSNVSAIVQEQTIIP